MTPAWEGVAQMACSAIRGLTLYVGDPVPLLLFCYSCGRVERVARRAEWQPLEFQLQGYIPGVAH